MIGAHHPPPTTINHHKPASLQTFNGHRCSHGSNQPHRSCHTFFKPVIYKCLKMRCINAHKSPNAYFGATLSAWRGLKSETRSLRVVRHNLIEKERKERKKKKKQQTNKRRCFLPSLLQLGSPFRATCQSTDHR